MIKRSKFIGLCLTIFLIIFSITSPALNAAYIKQGKYVYSQKGEELIDGKNASITWVFNVNKDDNIIIDISSWHAPITCNGKYKVIKTGDEFNLVWLENENQGIDCDSPSPQFSIRQTSNDSLLIKSKLFPWEDNSWKKLNKISN